MNILSFLLLGPRQKVVAALNPKQPTKAHVRSNAEELLELHRELILNQNPAVTPALPLINPKPKNWKTKHSVSLYLGFAA